MSGTSSQRTRSYPIVEFGSGWPLDPAVVSGVNRLGADWGARQALTASGSSTVFSSLGVWPLLAMLADGAAGAARAELAAAIGIAPGHAAAQTRSLLDMLQRSAALHAALGIWVADRIRLDPKWTARFGAESIGRITGEPATDQPVLDAWARRHTDGLIERLPVKVNGSTLLLLASALSIRLRWRQRFADAPRGIAAGPWATTDPVVGLTRETSQLDDLSVVRSPAGPLTLVTVRGDGDIDVILTLAEPERTADQVLPTAIANLHAGASHRVGSQLEPGETAPGVLVSDVPSVAPAQKLLLRTVGFDISGTHNLTEHSDLFGLGTARRNRRGTFPGISAEELAVDGAAQTAMATFSAEGFVAAAVTAITFMAGAAPSLRPRNAMTRLVEVDFNRPFGFVAAHRPTGLALMTGWVGRPLPWPNA